MAGLEAQVEEVISDVRKRFHPFTYMEIGIADGETFCQVSKIISGNNSGWRSVGVDCNMYGGYHPEQVEQNCTCQHVSVTFTKPEGWKPIDPVWNRATVIFVDSRDLFDGIWQQPIHLCLIDGLHTKAGCITDFDNVEKYIATGGVVMIHDVEPYKHAEYDVMAAVKELGILDGRRPGWSMPKILAADHEQGGSNMLSVERTPL